MTNPITPPPELVQQWIRERDGLEHLATQAAQWGADQELEACCEWLAKYRNRILGADLKFVRRPKPPSLKEQALKTLQRLSKDGFPCNYQEDSDWDTIRRALEALPE